MASCEPGFSYTDITHNWLHNHADCVFWEAPRYNNDNGEWLCCQLAVVQASINNRPLAQWYVISRRGPCAENTNFGELQIYSTETPESSKKAALKVKDERATRYGDWSLQSPCLRSFLSMTPSLQTLTEDVANQALQQRHEICVQPKVRSDVVMYAWVEENTRYLQMYVPDTSAFVCDDPRFARVRAMLQRVLLRRPHVFLVGFVEYIRNVAIYYVYDAVACPPETRVSSCSEFVNKPLVQRLVHVHAVLQTESRNCMGDAVRMAPFQPCYTRKDLRMHADIFKSCDFSECIIRLSGSTALN